MPKEDELIAEARKEGIEQFLVSTLIYDDKNMLAFIKPNNYRESAGGHVKDYESLFSSAKREPKEEANLEVKIDKYLGARDFFLNGLRTRMFFIKGEVDFKLNSRNLKKYITLSDEHKGYLLLPTYNFKGKNFKDEQKSFLVTHFNRLKYKTYIKNRKYSRLVA